MTNDAMHDPPEDLEQWRTKVRMSTTDEELDNLREATWGKILLPPGAREAGCRGLAPARDRGLDHRRRAGHVVRQPGRAAGEET